MAPLTDEQRDTYIACLQGFRKRDKQLRQSIKDAKQQMAAGQIVEEINTDQIFELAEAMAADIAPCYDARDKLMRPWSRLAWTYGLMHQGMMRGPVAKFARQVAENTATD